MTIVRLSGFKIFTDNRGKVRCYHRKTESPIDLVAHPLGSASFFAECAKFTQQPAIEQRPGTLGLLIRQYRGHASFLELSNRTRFDYNSCFDYLKAIEDTPLVRFNAPLVVQIRDKAFADKGRKFGNYVKTCLSLIFSWGTERGFMITNPARGVRGIKRPKDLPDTNPPWSDENRYRVLPALPPQLLLPIHLMMFCGIDPGDAIKLPKTAIKDGCLDTKRQKTKEAVWVPLPQPVIDCLTVAPKHDAITLCATSKGKPWSKSGLDSAWQRVKADLGITDKLTLKGLRHTVATILAEMGYDERTIADMLGQRTIEMARHYSRHANKQRKMSAVVTSFNAELERRKAKA